MEYAEAMSQIPPTVTDELSARLLEDLGASALVELSAFIGARQREHVDQLSRSVSRPRAWRRPAG